MTQCDTSTQLSSAGFTDCGAAVEAGDHTDPLKVPSATVAPTDDPAQDESEKQTIFEIPAPGPLNLVAVQDVPS